MAMQLDARSLLQGAIVARYGEAVTRRNTQDCVPGAASKPPEAPDMPDAPIAAVRALPLERRDALVRAVERSCAGLSAARRQRLVELLKRTIFGDTSWSSFCTDFGISRSRFFADRKKVLELVSAIAVTFDESASRKGHSLTDYSSLLFVQARAAFVAGNSELAATLFDRIDDTALSPNNRFEAFRITINALAENKTSQEGLPLLEARVRAWSESTHGTTQSAYLANAASAWLQMQCALAGNSDRDGLYSSVGNMTALMHDALRESDRSVALAYCHMLAETIPAFIDRLDSHGARLQLEELQQVIARFPGLGFSLNGRAHLTDVLVHWWDPKELRRSQYNLRNAYALARETHDQHMVWECLYFETRNHLLRNEFSRALVTAKELFRSSCAVGNRSWIEAAKFLLSSVYRFLGRFAECAYLLSGLGTDGSIGALRAAFECEVANSKRQFHQMREQSAQLVALIGKHHLPRFEANALRLSAQAEYGLGSIHKAVAFIHAAVDRCESDSLIDPLEYRRIYETAFLITRERRYADTLLDLQSMLRRSADSGTKRTGLLTERQLQVARLAAAGFSNDRIAGSLAIGLRTVDWHLEKIFSRLAIHSRHQLASVLKEVSSESIAGTRSNRSKK